MTVTLDAPERLIDFPALTEARNTLNAKRDELAGIFTEAGPEYDMSQVKSIAGDTHAKVDHIRKLHEEIDDRKAKVDELLVVARAAAVAQQAGEKGSEPDDRKNKGRAPETKAGETKAFGRMFVESQAFKGFARGSGGGPQASLDIELKALTTGSWAPETTRTGRIEYMPTRPAPHIADLIPQTTTGQAAVVYMEETVFSNTAAETGEGDQFPEAQLGLEERTRQVRKIPVFVAVTEEMFEDEPRAESYVQNRLPFMIRQRLDLQILRGNGTAPNLLGTENVAGILSQAKGADPVPDALYKGMRRVRDTGFAEPSVVFMTPEKWEPVQLLRTADGIYIWGHPSAMGPTTMWGVPVVTTTAAPTTKALLGDYTNFSELAVRRGIDIQVSNSHGDLFVRGQLAVRADIRCAVVHYRPTAFCEVTGL